MAWDVPASADILNFVIEPPRQTQVRRAAFS